MNDFLERAKKSVEVSVDCLEEYYDYLKSFPEKATPGSLDKVAKAIELLQDAYSIIFDIQKKKV